VEVVGFIVVEVVVLVVIGALVVLVVVLVVGMIVPPVSNAPKSGALPLKGSPTFMPLLINLGDLGTRKVISGKLPSAFLGRSN